MQDAVGLIGKSLIIKEAVYKVKDFYFVPGTNRLYIGLQSPDRGIINWRYEDLLPYLTQQIKL